LGSARFADEEADSKQACSAAEGESDDLFCEKGVITEADVIEPLGVL